VGAGEVPGVEDLLRDETGPPGDVRVRVAQDQEPSELQRVRCRERDAVAAAEPEERVLELGLGEGVVTEVCPQALRRPPRERVLDRGLVEDAAELRLLHDAVVPRVIEGVREVGEGPGDAGDRDAVADGAVLRREEGTVRVDPRPGRGR
jgi:hypothetical protein